MNDWFEAERHVERAHEHYDAGRWDEAERELRSAISFNPNQAEWHFNLGLTLVAAGRWRDSIDAFEQAGILNPDDSHGHLMAGINALRAGEADRALPLLDESLARDGDSTIALAHKIGALSALGRHDDAETTFYLGQQIDADDPDLYAAMAESLLDRGLFERAVWCLREAAKLDPTMPRLQASLAAAYAGAGRHERARQLYLKELRLNPGDTDTLLSLGDLLANMGRLDEASEKFRRVLELVPDHVDAHFALGELAESRSDAHDALRQYEIVLRLDHEYPEARRRVAQLILSGVRAEDLSVVHRLLRLELRDVAERPHAFSTEDLDQLGGLLLDSGLYREAERLYTDLASRHPERAIFSHLLAVARFERGDRIGGIEAERVALGLEPRFLPAIHNLALAYLEQGQWTRAWYWVRQGLAIDTDDHSLRRLRVRLRLVALTSGVRWLARRVGRRETSRRNRTG